jgi:hypothetical protein
MGKKEQGEKNKVVYERKRIKLRNSSWRKINGCKTVCVSF